MKVIYNEELHKNEWVVSKWYEKTQFVIGVIYFWILAAAFVLGFANAILN